MRGWEGGLSDGNMEVGGLNDDCSLKLTEVMSPCHIETDHKSSRSR